MSILSELKKLTNKNNAKVISEALPDEMGGSGTPLILEFATTNPYTVATPISVIDAAIKAGRQVWLAGIALTSFHYSDEQELGSLIFSAFEGPETYTIIRYHRGMWFVEDAV